MLSRRRFLQAHAAGLALPLASASFPTRGVPACVASSMPEMPAERDYWNDWPRYLTAKVNEARARRKAALAAIRSPEQARERGVKISAEVWRMIGGPLEKTPLNPEIVGTIQREGYRIEKVIFESQPQVYVTAHLYLPTKGQPPFPAILGPLGHARNGKAHRNYQYVFQTLARKGYVVLAFDPYGQGERLQYLEAGSGRPRMGPTGEHSQAGRPLLLLGATFAQYRVWDGIRALDYLLSRPEVDAPRIGCTGHSGGGTMTMYLCALEPRIKAAVEVQGNTENLAGPNYSPPGAVADAEQNLVGSLAVGLDRGDLLCAFAPKPLLVCYTPQDSGTTYSPAYTEATQEIYEELRQVYKLLGAEEKVGLFASPLPHDFDFFTRQATYEWFNRWVAREERGTDESEFDASPPQTLNCTSTGQVLTSLGGRSVVQLNRDRMRLVMGSGHLGDVAADPHTFRNRVRARLHHLLALPGDRGPLEARVLSSNSRRDLTIEEFEFQSEPRLRLPGWFIKPVGGPRVVPTILHVSGGGKDDVVEEPGELDALVRQGYAICAFDLRGLGISTPHYPAAGPLFYRWEHLDDGYAWASLMLGRPVLGQRVWDVLRCLDYLQTRPDVDHDRILLVGVGEAGLAALMAAAFDDRSRAILLRGVLADLHSLVEAENYSLRLSWFPFGILGEFDLPDLVASLAPRPCWLLNAEGPQGERLAASNSRSRYQRALDQYARLGAKDKLRFLVQLDQEWPSALGDWVRAI